MERPDITVAEAHAALDHLLWAVKAAGPNVFGIAMPAYVEMVRKAEGARDLLAYVADKQAAKAAEKRA